MKKIRGHMEYLSLKTFAETLTLINRWRGRTTLVAGGTNVIPEMRAKAILC